MADTALYTSTDRDSRTLAAIANLRDYSTARCDLALKGRYVASARILGTVGDRIKVEVTRVDPGATPTVTGKTFIGDVLAVPARLVQSWTC